MASMDRMSKSGMTEGGEHRHIFTTASTSALQICVILLQPGTDDGCGEMNLPVMEAHADTGVHACFHSTPPLFRRVRCRAPRWSTQPKGRCPADEKGTENKYDENELPNQGISYRIRPFLL